ncbi:hypothetical protein [Agrococcus jejuensis]|uniref:SipW-cognate class signal peptide n=1 Tax=Agrococcus jejuensis TaxID=399736 RepID=A0A1G7ZMU0_9MICO|nr:hypothetical protein [Agrococcus jejuensis]SDH09959.1 hypothetical protein SAMN04489720_0031 [Agrococcus jejuensis]
MSTNAPTRRTHRKKLIAIVTAAFVLAGGGVAYAWWSTTGTGTGTATTGTAGVVAVAQTSEVGGLAPGRAAQPLAGTISNTTTSALYVSTVTVSISSITKNGTAVTGCTAADYTLVQPAAVNQDIPASGQQAWTGASIQFNNRAANQNACQGVTVNLSYTVG